MGKKYNHRLVQDVAIIHSMTLQQSIAWPLAAYPHLKPPRQDGFAALGPIATARCRRGFIRVDEGGIGTLVLQYHIEYMYIIVHRVPIFTHIIYIYIYI